jgi:LysM repeat protein
MKYIFKILVVVFFFSCSSTKAQTYKTHKVQVGETIESIAKIYMVTPYDLYALNPDAKTDLQPNAVLIIPKTKIADVPVVSQVKEVKGLKKHKVKRRETLYSLSKKYNVTIEDIKKANKRLYSENLRKGDRINIPEFRTVLKTETLANTIKKYTVLPKEGKWRVAYKFGISIEELDKLNPELGGSLAVGQEINVPNIADNEEKAVDDAYGYYTVLPKEGFYRLKLKLGLEQEALENLNPELKITGLKVGMVLKVPAGTDLVNAEGIEGTKVDLTSRLNNIGTKRLAVMLPFRLQRVDVDSTREAKRLLQTDPYLRPALDFHSGVLMALQDAKDKGISVVLDVYDTQNREAEVSNILNSNDFSQVDAVIGPFMKKHVDRVSLELKRKGVPVFVPLASDVQLRDNVFQTKPSEELLFKQMVAHVKKDSTIQNIILISDIKNKGISDKLKLEFPGAKQIVSRKDNKKEKDAYYILIDDIQNELKEGKNVVFLHTSKEGFVSNVSSMLNSFIDETKEVVLMTTSHNRAYEGNNISNYHLSNLKFQYPSVNMPYDNDSKNEFVKRYEEEYHEPPNKFAVRGYDLTMDVLLRMASEEDLKAFNDDALTTEYTENKFQYAKKMFGGYYNQAMYIVKYDDLKIIEAN